MPATSKRHEQGQARPAHGQQLNVPQGRPAARRHLPMSGEQASGRTKCGRSPDWTMNDHNWSICSLGYGQPVEAVTHTKSAICGETGSAVTGNPGTPCDEHRAIFVAAAGSDGRPHSNDETRPPDSSHPDTTGYQLRREFSRTEGSSCGTHGVICDQGPESRWVGSLKSAWRITAPPRPPCPCDGSAGVGKNPVTRGHLEGRPWSAGLAEDAVGLTG